MKQIMSDLLAKVTTFLQQLAAKSSTAQSINVEEIKRSVSSATLNLQTRVSAAVTETGKAETTSVSPEAPEVSPVTDSVAEPVIEKVEVKVAQSVTKPQVQSAVVASDNQIPEDSTLRRHYLTQRQAEIYADLGDEPSDSTLKRHYQQLLANKIADQ